MNIQLIPTPIHDATSITIDTAAIEAEIQRIASIDYASFVHDIDQLSIVLYASDPSICAQYLSHPADDYRRVAAKKAMSLHSNPNVIQHLATTGYFREQLRQLLKIGIDNNDFGANLVPVFASMLEQKEDYGLDDNLECEIHRFYVWEDWLHGFLILNLSTEECVIMPSLWRREVS